jgi:chemotaxis methyl-accepting protein methylase
VLESSVNAYEDLLDRLLVAPAHFFQPRDIFAAFQTVVLPEMHLKKFWDSPRSLRIWSAGCGTGEEAYSIAMACCEAIPAANGNGGTGSANGNGNGNGSKAAGRSGGIAEASASSSSSPVRDWSIHIVGSDLLPSAIRIAERGLYPQSALTGLPPVAIRACFSKIGSPNGNGLTEIPQNGSTNGNGSSSSNGNFSANGSSNGAHLLVKPRLRSLVTFNTMNLTKPVYIGRFDCIFCMDVLPHLSRAQRVALMERLHLYLEPGGYLFLSQTEKLCTPNLNFRAETYDGYTCYRKPMAASAAYGR